MSSSFKGWEASSALSLACGSARLKAITRGEAVSDT